MTLADHSYGIVDVFQSRLLLNCNIAISTDYQFLGQILCFVAELLFSFILYFHTLSLHLFFSFFHVSFLHHISALYAIHIEFYIFLFYVPW